MARQSDPAVKNQDLKAIAAGPKGGKGTADRAKRKVLDLIADGYKTAEAMALVGRSAKTYETWRRTDRAFAEEASRLIGRRNRTKESQVAEVPDFPEFCEKYLHAKLFWHQLQWYDLLEGRVPRDLHPAQVFTKGSDPCLLLCNTPPAHAKSTTITVYYTVWRIIKDPNVQVLIVSKNEAQAKKFLTQIKDILVSRTFEKLQSDFGPADGYEKASVIWSAKAIQFGPTLRDVNAKDPTVEAVGMGGQIYGNRNHLIILDDCVDTTNAAAFEEQIDWITRIVLTRPEPEDRVLMVGTRVAPVDLYGELMNPSRYDDGEAPWTYFAQPAVLEYADDPNDWVTLWPRTNVPTRARRPDADGLYPKWNGPNLALMRKKLSTSPSAWSQGYQQQAVSETSVFTREMVYGVVNGMRGIGPLKDGTPGHPPDGMRGMRVIAGLDPASTGHTAAVVVAFDPMTNKRWVLDAHNQAAMTPDQIRKLMTGWTQRYGITEWRVEKVLLSQFILQDREIQQALANLGCTLHPHITGGNKWDPIAGVMSLTGLFYGWEDNRALIDLPSVQSEVIRALAEQLVTFFPETRGKTDLLMALWFVETRVREWVQTANDFDFMESQFMSEEQLSLRTVVDLNDLDPNEPLYFSPFRRN